MSPLADDTGEEQEQTYKQREFEKQFFSDATNEGLLSGPFCNMLCGIPVSNEIGKSVVFAVSQNHAARLTQTLNEMAASNVSGQGIKSDFAVQVTSQIAEAQQYTIRFANNNLMGTRHDLARILYKQG